MLKLDSPAGLHALWRPYTQHALAEAPIEIARAQGATLFAKDGRRIFDAVSSWWVNLHGHAHPKIAAAVAEQAARLEQVIFAGFTHEPAERLAERLLAVVPKGLEHVFLSDNGSTSVEVALKMALGHFAHRGRPRGRIAALEHAYHGDTFGAMSVSAPSAFSADFEKLLFSVDRVPFPAHGREKIALDALERLLSQARTAALILEPLVLGAGGMLMYEPRVLREMAELCRAHGTLLIADEVMTGFGRTGTMFACEAAGVSPDILCLSKGITGGFLPLGATLASAEIFDSFYSSDRRRTLFHGHSYTGSPLACAAAVASLDIFASEPVFERIAFVSAFHEKALKRFAGRKEVAAVRSRGTIAAVELRAEDAGYFAELGPRLYRHFIDSGVLLRPLGNVVYLMPPYCSTPEQLENAYDAIEDSLSLLDAR